MPYTLRIYYDKGILFGMGIPKTISGSQISDLIVCVSVYSQDTFTFNMAACTWAKLDCLTLHVAQIATALTVSWT